MAIRLLAKELYRVQQEVEKLQARIEAAPHPEKDALREELRKKKAEWQRLRNFMEGAKTPPVRGFKPKV
jgi:predicted nuclease with TOPRIM domain